jgi:hypothetical protein
MKLDYLFARHDPGTSRRQRREPQLTVIPRPGLPVPAPKDGETVTESPGLFGGALPRLPFAVDPRRMSPRQLAEWAHEMYLCRLLNWEEYCLAGFPAELHPHYNRTVGALIGQVAQPDSPKDMIRAWEERLAFTLRYNDPEDADVLRTEKVLRLLRRHQPGR